MRAALRARGFACNEELCEQRLSLLLPRSARLLTIGAGFGATCMVADALLDDPTPYAYSAVRSAQPLGMRSQHEPPHLAATAPRPAAPRINPRQLKSGRATSELMEPEFRYRPTQSILTKIDVRKKYEFPGSYDPILGLGAPEAFDHPNISYHDLSLIHI